MSTAPENVGGSAPLIRYVPKLSTTEAIRRLVGDRRIVYCAMHTTWWTVRSEDLARTRPEGLPCDPRGSVLLETDAEEFIQRAEEAPDFYGDHGLAAFIAAYHANLEAPNGRPTSLRTWDEVNAVLTASVEAANRVLTAIGGGEVVVG